jgi:uncharacterized repeat protein (TIGR01451 family)
MKIPLQRLPARRPHWGTLALLAATLTALALVLTLNVGVASAGGCLDFSVSPASLDFGVQAIGAAGTPQTVTVTNTCLDAQFQASVDSSNFILVVDGCTGTTLGGLQSCSIEVAFAPTAVGSTSGTLSIQGTQGGEPVETETVDLSGSGIASSDLSVSIGASPDRVKPSGTITYTMTVANAGPTDASAVVLQDTLPATGRLQSATPSSGTCTGVAKNATGTLTCTLGNMSAGASGTATILIKVVLNKGTVTNTASVTSNIFDPNTANNTATITTPVK